eukprot:TRINITY_DN32605_c0_g1_i1.p1 TRINITY_DN32605_c0_g1~~TRINITY_DN32605_c0_g1_i1.p1  ORF type:complete len:383 (+),score=72.98 TRINITY_DN32605_c0_g1_i1:167-1150(+)
MVILQIVVGVSFFHWFCGASSLTAFYVIVQILTTIGYGDITVDEEYHQEQDAENKIQFARFFLAVYVLGSIVVVSYALNIFMSWTISMNHSLVQSSLTLIETKTLGISKDTLSRHLRGNRLVASALTFIGFLMAGTLFYGCFERCSCSYGLTRTRAGFNESCVESSWDLHVDMEICMAAGGFEKTYIDAFYMSVITLTTVGFGDFAPKTQPGRFFGIFWMTGGVAATAFFTAELSKYMFERKKSFEGAAKINRKAFDAIDIAGTGHLTRAEYIQYMLVSHGLCEQEYIDKINEKFDAMDLDGTGVVTWDEIKLGKLRALSARNDAQG